MREPKNKLTEKIESRKKIQINRLKTSLSKYILKKFLDLKKKEVKSTRIFFLR
jgi:hypothetical protein